MYITIHVLGSKEEMSMSGKQNWWRPLSMPAILLGAVAAVFSGQGSATFTPKPWTFTEVIFWAGLSLAAGLLLLFITSTKQ
jgi:hypothetical protein